MASVSNIENKKWLNSAVAIAAILVGYIWLGFIGQLGEWFELESKVPYFRGMAQGSAVVVGMLAFLITTKNSISASFLRECFTELTKVVWPDKNANVKHTFGIIVGVTVVGFFWLTSHR